MSHNYNAGNTPPSSGGGADPVPDGAYRLIVTDVQETKPKAGDYQVIVTFRVSGGQYDKRKIPFHRVTFFGDNDAPGAGIALAFLKALGQPYKGKFSIDPEAWKGKTLTADVGSEEYNGRLNNKILGVDADTPDQPAKADQEKTAAPPVQEEVPF